MIRNIHFGGLLQVSVQIQTDDALVVARKHNAVPHLRDHRLVALDVSVRRDLKVVIHVQPVVTPAPRRNYFSPTGDTGGRKCQTKILSHAASNTTGRQSRDKATQTC
jgi:hypothetical protein